MSPSDAMKSLIKLGGEAKIDTTATTQEVQKSHEHRTVGNTELANSMYEAIHDYQGTFTSVQKDQATEVLMQMRSGKITSTQAVSALAKI